jgi:AAHS family 4-hydroxybenzoate transporter-like MFS transporter
VDASTEFVSNETSRGGVPFVHLFREGRGVFTVLLWVVNFMNILVLYSLSNWLPTIVTGMGYEQRTAVLVGTLLQVGGTIGTFGLAWLIARRGFVPMLTVTFGLAAVSIALIGQPGISLVLLCIIVFVAGWCIVGGQPGINAMSATYYPTFLRSTGVGAGLGVGRVGAIVGPYIGGVLLARQWGPQELFLAAALPAVISTLVMLAIRAYYRDDATARAAPAAAPLPH